MFTPPKPTLALRFHQIWWKPLIVIITLSLPTYKPIPIPFPSNGVNGGNGGNVMFSGLRMV